MFADDKEPPASPDSRTLDDSGFGEGDESEFDDVSTASSERDPILQESIELPDRSSTLTPDLKNLAMRDSVSEQLGSTDNGDVQAETGQSMPNFPQILDQPLHTENNIIVKGKILEKSSGQSFKLELLAEEEIDEMGASKPASTIPLQIVGTFENNTITVKASKVSEGKPIEEKVENIKYNEGDQIKILIDVREESFKVYANDEAIGGISYSDLSIVKKITVDGYIDVNSVVVEDRVRRQAIALSYDELRALQNTLLTTLNARRGNATGDGNCFYNSVSLILHGNEQASGDLRKTCIEHMVKNADHFKPIFLIHIKQNNLEFRMFEKYVEDQAKDEAWAEWPEIVCMADYLGQEIHIYVTNNDPTEKAEPRVAKPETEPIRLLYNGQTHYDAIIKKDQKDRSHKADDANDPAMGADIPELPEAEEAIEKPAPDDKQARIKELKEAIEILYSKYSENAVVIKDNKVVNEVVCNITNCKKVVLKPGMRNDNANVAIQDHIAKHFYEDEVNGHQYRFICKECNKGYNKCEDGRNHYRKSCKKMDKEKYPSWKDGFIDNMNDWPFEPVRNIVLKIFDDEGFITKLPKIIVDNWREQIQEKLNALEADTVDLFKIPDDGLVRCRHCGASLNFEDPNSIQTIADHFSKMNSEWTTKTWTTNKLKPVILEAMLTSGNVYDLPGHYHNLLKNHLVDKKFIDLGAQIVEKIKEKTEIKEKHKIYALVDGQHLRELLEQSDFDKILTDPIIYIGKGLSNRPSAHCSRDLRNALEHFIHDNDIMDPIDAAYEFVNDYDGEHEKKYKRLMASILSEKEDPIYKVVIEVESAELQNTAEASLIAALMPFGITNEQRGEWPTTIKWKNTKKRAVGIHFFNILSEKLKNNGYKPVKTLDIKGVTGKVSNDMNIEEQRNKVERRRQLARAKLEKDIQDMADPEKIKKGEQWHNELTRKVRNDQSSIYWLSDSKEIPEARQEASLATCQNASIYFGAKLNEKKKGRQRRMYDHGREAKLFDTLEDKNDFKRASISNVPKCERLIEVGKLGANTLVLEIGKLSEKQHIAAEWALINSSIGSTATNCRRGDDTWPTVLPVWSDEKKRELQLYWIDRLLKAVQNDQFERESIKPCDVLASIPKRETQRESCPL